MSAVFEKLSTMLLLTFLLQAWNTAADTCRFLVLTHIAAMNPVTIYSVVKYVA